MVDNRSCMEVHALRYLAQREHSRLELEQKISASERSCTKEPISSVLDKLEQKDLLSAERIIEQVIRMRRPRFGYQRIVYELRKKGIDENLIYKILPTLKETEVRTAFEIWKKRFVQLPNTKGGRDKQVKFMISRGFSMQIFQQILSQADEENR